MSEQRHKGWPKGRMQQAWDANTHLFQLKLSTAAVVGIRVQAGGKQGPHGGGIHVGVDILKG